MSGGRRLAKSFSSDPGTVVAKMSKFNAKVFGNGRVIEISRNYISGKPFQVLHIQLPPNKHIPPENNCVRY